MTQFQGGEENLLPHREGMAIQLYGSLFGLIIGLLVSIMGVWYWPLAGGDRSSRPSAPAHLGGGSVLGGPVGQNDNPGSIARSRPGREQISGQAYAFHRIAEMQMKLHDVKEAVASVRKIDSPVERDDVLVILLNTLRQSEIFDPTRLSPQPPNAESIKNQLRGLKEGVELAEEITDPALKAGFLASIADLRFVLSGTIPQNAEPQVSTLLSEAKRSANQISPTHATSGTASVTWLLGVLGLITTSLATAGGFVVATFTKAVVDEWGKKLGGSAIARSLAAAQPVAASPVAEKA